MKITAELIDDFGEKLRPIVEEIDKIAGARPLECQGLEKDYLVRELGKVKRNLHTARSYLYSIYEAINECGE